MKKFLLLLMAIFVVAPLFAQQKTSDTTKPKSDTSSSKQKDTSATKKDTTKVDASVSNDNNFGWKNRFAFIIGGGFSTTGKDLYNDPVINKTNNNVILESAQKLRTSLTLGLVFTPKIFNVKRAVEVPKDKHGKQIDTDTLIEYYPRKWSFAMFLNPISLTKLNDNTFTNSVDIGFGVGWREGDWLLMATVDFFSIRQPREYFVNQFKDNNKTYVVNNQTQSSIDITDNSIFHNVIVPSFGIKMAYTFSLARSFYSNSQQLTK